MDNMSESSSLQIIQPDHQIVFSSSSNLDSQTSKIYDLDYSKDQPSLSFAIEQQRQHSYHHQKQQQPPQHTITNQPPKRKRKQIFQKYKYTKKTQQKSISEIINEEDDVLRTFDEIFKINTTRSQNQSPQRNLNFLRKIQSENEGLRTQAFTKKKYQSVNSNSNDVVNSQYRSENVYIQKQTIKTKLEEPDKKQQIKESNFFNSQVFFETPFTQTPIKNHQENQHENQQGNRSSINISNIEGGLSYIQGRHNFSISKDMDEITDMLNTEIFRDEEFKNTQQSNQFNQLNNKTDNFKETQSVLGESRSTQIYQNIDLSSSIAPSIMMKQSRIGTTQQLPSSQFLGNPNPKRAQTTHNLFSALQSQQKQQTELNLHNYTKIKQNIHSEKRIPIFLRQIHKINQIYPNFENPTFRVVLVEHENHSLRKLIEEFLRAIALLQSMVGYLGKCSAERDRVRRMVEAGVRVQEFMKANWKFIEFPAGLQEIRPRDLFEKRSWNQKKAIQALQNYRKIAEYYIGMRINLKDQRGISKYFDIRKKFWDIQRNIRMISQDIYSQIISNQLPRHYNQFYQILANQGIVCEGFSWEEKRLLFATIKLLQDKEDLLAVSEVGHHVYEILNDQLKFHYSL